MKLILLLLALLLGLGGLNILMRRYFRLRLPYHVAVRLVARGQKEKASRLFERVLAMPSAPGHLVKREARFRLSWLYMEQGRYEAAAELLQTNLALPRPPSRSSKEWESNTRQRLAEALEGAGQTEAANAERKRATEILDGAEESVGNLLSEAKLLNTQQRFDEEYALLERTLPLIPAPLSELRAQTMARLALAAFHSGKTEQIIRWGEEALTLNPTHTIRSTAHGMCGLGYATLGKLDDSERHRRQRLELEQKVGNQDKVAECLVQLAMVQHRRGSTNEAMRLCEEAKEKSIASRSTVYAQEMECLKSWGRFQEAWETLQLVRRAQKFPTPSAQKRMSAVYDSAEAVSLLDLQRPEEALPFSDRALEGLKNDTKLTLQYTANRVWILACLKREAEARTLTATVETGLSEFAEARGIQRDSLYSLGRAYYELGDYPASLAYWQRYHALDLDPVSQPTSLYYQGMCHQKLGNIEAAQALFRQAVALDIDTYDTRRAKQELAGDSFELVAPIDFCHKSS